MIVPLLLKQRFQRCLNVSQRSRFLSESTRKQISDLIKTNDVVVFMKGEKSQPQCGFSNAVVQILRINGVSQFKDVNVLADAEMRQGIKEFTPWPTIPQLYVKGEFIGGCDILLSMQQSGELEKLLEEKGLIRKSEAKQ